MIKKVGLILCLLSAHTHALVPVEGILLGDATPDFQNDPLSYVFSEIYDKTDAGENGKVKLYQSSYKAGALLVESCNYFKPATYASNWKEVQAKRSMVATLQYIGLDTTIKAIGAYAQRLQMSEDNYQILVKNLTTNYCSKNLSVMSVRNVEKSLQYYFSNPLLNVIPSVENSPFATMDYKLKTEKPESRSREFDYAIRNFKSFCSWGGDVEDYRLLSPYLKNPFIQAMVIRNLSGQNLSFDPQSMKVNVSENSPKSVKVICRDLICRQSESKSFEKQFPLSIGSTGLATDLTKLYCHHFKYQDYRPGNTLSEVKSWIKASEIEEPILESSFFISLMTGVPDPMFGVQKYNEIPALAKSSVDERWSRWSKDVLNNFSKDLLFEESLKIKTQPRRSPAELANEGFRLDFSVTLGELDRMMNNTDKFDMSFDLKLSKNYLRSLRSRWDYLTRELDEEAQVKFKKEIATYLDHNLKNKEKLFRQKIWNEKFATLLADELLSQVLAYRGPMFSSYQDSMITVPVKFSYGLFALSYLRYKADVDAGRLKLNL